MERPAQLRWLAVAFAIATLGLPIGSSAESNSLIDLGANVIANGINGSGQVTGCAPAAGGATHAFIYSAGVTSDLGTLGGSNSCGFAINASGQVTGYAATTASGVPHAFLYASGSMVDLGSLPASDWPGSSKPPDSMGLAINGTGEVVGAASGGADLALTTNFYSWMMSADDDPFSAPIGFLYGGGTISSVLIQPPGSSIATGINDSGMVIGTRAAGLCETLCPQAAAFLTSNGTTTSITSLGKIALFFSVPTGINAAGQVAGYGESLDAHMHAFLFSGGTATDLGADTEAYAINSGGQIVGLSRVGLGHAIGPAADAFLYNDGISTDLNLPGAVPSGINDSGWIIVNDPTLQHAYLLRPSAVSLTPTGLSFSNLVVGVVSPARAVTLSNGTAGALGIGPISITAPFSQTNNCPASLDAGTSCVIEVTFTGGTATELGALSVPTNGTTYVTLVRGMGTVPVSISASAASVLVGQTFTLTWSASTASTTGAACTASGGSGSDAWGGPWPASGTINVTEPAAGSYTFTLTCSSSTATGAASTAVDVKSAPVTTQIPPPVPPPTSGGGNVDPLLLLALCLVLTGRRIPIARELL